MNDKRIRISKLTKGNLIKFYTDYTKKEVWGIGICLGSSEPIGLAQHKFYLKGKIRSYGMGTLRVCAEAM